MNFLPRRSQQLLLFLCETAVEMITATAWCGIVYALLGGQPIVRILQKKKTIVILDNTYPTQHLCTNQLSADD